MLTAELGLVLVALLCCGSGFACDYPAVAPGRGSIGCICLPVHPEDSVMCLCRIAPEYLAGTKPQAAFETDESPLIVFINARSGGRVGAELAGVLARAVGSSQVRAAAAAAGPA